MLMDLVMELVTATDNKDKERAYRKLEKVGVDRRTADVMAAEFWKEGAEMSEDKVAIHYGSENDPWIEFFAIVAAERMDEAEAAVRRAVDEYWESDDQCYGDVVELALNKAGLEYRLMLCEYDSTNDEPTEAWAVYRDNIYRQMPVIEI